MDYLLAYIKALRLTPVGLKKITPTQKLALLIFILQAEGGEVTVNPDLLAEELLLGNVKSLWRLLSDMEDLGLIQINPRRDERGHKLPPGIIPLPQIERKPSNLQATKPNPSNLQGTPSNLQGTPSNLQATKLENGNSNGYHSLPSKDFGTKLALTPPPDLIQEGGENPSNPDVTRLSAYPAVRVWLELVGESLPETAARLIARRVTHITAWADTLEGWLANPRWSKHNVASQIERYEKNLRLGNYPPETTDAENPSPFSPKDREDNENYRSLIYGDE